MANDHTIWELIRGTEFHKWASSLPSEEENTMANDYTNTWSIECRTEAARVTVRHFLPEMIGPLPYEEAVITEEGTCVKAVFETRRRWPSEAARRVLEKFPTVTLKVDIDGPGVWWMDDEDREFCFSLSGDLD